MTSNPQTSRIPVWIDTDCSAGVPMRDVDDAMALLHCFNSSEIMVMGISVVFGNTSLSNAIECTRFVLESFFPMSSVEYPCPSGPHIGAASASELGVNTEAVDAMAAYTQDMEDHSVVFLALGPLTNIATFLLCHPELRCKVRDIIMVAGRSPGLRFYTGTQTSRAHPDLNFQMDHEAVRTLLHMNDIPITLAGFEVSSKVWITPAAIEELRSSQNHGAQWLASVAHPWLKFWYDVFGNDIPGFNPFDQVAAAVITHPHLFHASERECWLTYEPRDAAGLQDERMQGCTSNMQWYLNAASPQDKGSNNDRSASNSENAPRKVRYVSAPRNGLQTCLLDTLMNK